MRRREVLALGLVGAAAAVATSAPLAAGQGAGVERGSTRITGFASGELDFQLMRSLGAANSGGAAPGEVFAARAAIVGDDPYAWPPAFAAMADRVLSAGNDARSGRHSVSAREHYLRASMYYRAAEYFAEPGATNGIAWGIASRDAFRSAAQLMADRVDAITVPFEGRDMPGYFMRPKMDAVAGRTVLMLTGFDGTAEELYFQAGAAALERGYNVMTVEGPGQVGCMRLHPELKFRPDYEKPIAAMIDAALASPGVAPERLALYGISFGGYFAIRAAEYDGRIKALVLNSPITTLFGYMAGFAGGGMFQNPPPIKLSEVDAIPDSEFPRAAKLSFKSACRRFGVNSFADWVDRLKTFTADKDLARVRCPALAMVGTGEGKEARAQFEQFSANASGPVTRRLFTAEEGADMHCQLGNLPLSNAVVFDWLDEVLAA